MGNLTFRKRGELLRHVMPILFGPEYVDAPAQKFGDVVVNEIHMAHGIHRDDYAFSYKPWPGRHKNVWFWVELVNGYAVGFNENLSRGWSFPVIKMRKE